MKKFIIMILLLISQKQVLFSQTIQIGERLPNLTFNKLVNYTKPNFSSSDFKGKLFILDFWFTTCAPCLSMMKKTDSLANEFPGKVEFVPVTFEKQEVVRKFLTGFNRENKLNVASIVEDTQLHKLLKPTGNPFYVWINSEGVVVARTSRLKINANMIQMAIKGNYGPLSEEPSNNQVTSLVDKFFSVKRVLPIDTIRFPYAKLDSGISYSAFSSYLPGYITSFRKSARLGLLRFVNFQASRMFRIAFGRHSDEFAHPERVLWEVADTSLKMQDFKYIDEIFKRSKTEANAWWKDNTFCYEFKWPKGASDDFIWKSVQEDLNRFYGQKFGIYARMEKRNMECLVVKRTSANDKLSYDPENLKPWQTEGSHGSMFQIISGWMNTLGYPGQPVTLNETNFEGTAQVILKENLSNLEQVNKALEKYDLKIIKEMKNIDMIVIRKIDK